MTAVKFSVFFVPTKSSLQLDFLDITPPQLDCFVVFQCSWSNNVFGWMTSAAQDDICGKKVKLIRILTRHAPLNMENYFPVTDKLLMNSTVKKSCHVAKKETESILCPCLEILYSSFSQSMFRRTIGFCEGKTSIPWRMWVLLFYILNQTRRSRQGFKKDWETLLYRSSSESYR